MFLVTAIFKGCTPWLHIERINTGDFESVRTAISPDLEALFREAQQEFEKGDYLYRYPESVSYERYGAAVRIAQFKEDDGTTYEVLFAYTSLVRGFGGGYYYTSSGNLPPVAPTFGVVCSKHMEGRWYAFNTVDSMSPPNPKNCPEDIQYSSTDVPTD
jgi:hypothetical protein